MDKAGLWPLAYSEEPLAKSVLCMALKRLNVILPLAWALSVLRQMGDRSLTTGVESVAIVASFAG